MSSMWIITKYSEKTLLESFVHVVIIASALIKPTSAANEIIVNAFLTLGNEAVCCYTCAALKTKSSLP